LRRRLIFVFEHRELLAQSESLEDPVLRWRGADLRSQPLDGGQACPGD
jgi:hypothetical protein